MEQAAAWFSLLHSGTVIDADRARWQGWLASSEDHRAAWAVVERVSQRFRSLQADASPRQAADALQLANRRLARRRVVLGVAAIAGAGSALGWTLWRQPGAVDALLAWAADYRTGTGERHEVRLADGTRVWLGSASAFDQNYGASLRRLRLRAGEILIQTAAEAARPFVVDTAQGRMRALGTRFNVRLDGEGGTLLAVYEGAVQITLAASAGRAAAGSAAAGNATIGAGQQVRFTADRLEAIVPADPAREVWSRGVLLAQDIPLGQVVAELSRYRHGHMAVAPDVAGLPVLGSYPLDDVDGALAMLQKSLPIRIRRPLPWWTTIEARAS
ncbi:iron dicitrate transport regulator FecR [Bordetella genomosp. 10]|uniref:Iron dicitrate transport regulator FecR n=2 Tax=Bordetella genomosp. 10 TaxID=1416804 RepID=A0A261S5A3_9BORD|nr:iron dicitrate transport regulator FecR [Bordetella genomosp. 10]